MAIGNIGLQEIHLDISTKLRQKTFYANEVDTEGRGLHAFLQDNGIKVDGTGVTMQFRYKSLNDGESKVYDFTPIGDAINGEFEMHYPTEMVRGHGNKLFPCTIVARDSTSELAFENVFVYVNKAEVNTEGVEASNEYSALKKSLDDVVEVQTQMGNIDPVLMANTITVANEIVPLEAQRAIAEAEREAQRLLIQQKLDNGEFKGDTFTYTDMTPTDKQDLVSNATEQWNPDFETKYTALETEYATDLTGVKSQLADNTTKQGRNTKNIAERAAMGSHFNQVVRPLGTVIDDDGIVDVLTKLKQIFLDFGIPMGVAVNSISDVIVNPTRRAELLDLQNNHGWEVLSHTYNHNLVSLTPEEIEEDCKLSLKTFSEYGFDIFNIVYPYSLPSANVARIISKYYSAGFGTSANYNTISNIQEYNIYRVAIGSFMAEPYVTLAQFKTLVDTVKANNGWLVLMTHMQPTDEAGVTLIHDVLEYMVAQGVEIVTPTEGLRVFGSVAQSGLKSEKYFHLKSGGVVDTNNYVMIKRPTKLETDPPMTDSSMAQIQFFSVSGWSKGDGLVTEFVGANGFQSQEFRKTGTGAIEYMRKWTGSAWSVWYKYLVAQDSFTKTISARTVPANSTVDITLYDALAFANRTYIAQPTGVLESGITWDCWSNGDGAYILRLSNLTTTDKAIAERVWRITGLLI